MIGKIERINLRDVWKHEAFNLYHLIDIDMYEIV